MDSSSKLQLLHFWKDHHWPSTLTTVLHQAE
jgi:hypothetical protein